MIGASADTIHRLIASGELRSYRIGAARFIPAHALEDLIARKLEEGR
jgi:excisionase family DNA binding protein